jgi:hypothetical protein
MQSTNVKACFKCGTTQPLDNFYAHQRMADGHLGKCKECTKADVRRNRRDKLEYYQTYDRMRFQLPERRAAQYRSLKERNMREPQKYKARMALGNAVRDGRVKRLPCEVCGHPDTEGHHKDYSKPLDVRWLCFKHHREAHGQVVLN